MKTTSPFQLFVSIFLCIFSFLFSPLQAKDSSEEEIVVQLATEVPLLPMCVGPFQNDASEFSSDYLQSLRSILIFDLNYNGATKVITSQKSDALKALSKEEEFQATCSFDKWKDAHVFYLVKLKMHEKNLSAKVISMNGKSTKLIEGLSFCGDLSKDRRKIHQLADSIMELLFQRQGCAQDHILFTVRRKIPSSDASAPDWTSEIYEADIDGANCKKVASDGAAYLVTPAFLNKEGKGSLLFFVSYKIGQPKIYFASLQGGKFQRLTSLRGNQLTPAITKDGKQIAFASDTTGKSDLFLMPFQPETLSSGKPRQIFAAKGAAQASPTFSPEGEQIAFASNKDGSPKIYVMDIPKIGTKLKDIHPKLISKRCKENSSPAWSPDGKKIAFSAKSQGPRQIWIYDFETGEERQLTQGKGDKENPAWAKDSLHLLFNSTVKDTTELYLINLNQREAIKIPTVEGEKRFPLWK